MTRTDAVAGGRPRRPGGQARQAQRRDRLGATTGAPTCAALCRRARRLVALAGSVAVTRAPIPRPAALERLGISLGIRARPDAGHRRCASRRPTPKPSPPVRTCAGPDFAPLHARWTLSRPPRRYLYNVGRPGSHPNSPYSCDTIRETTYKRNVIALRAHRILLIRKHINPPQVRPCIAACPKTTFFLSSFTPRQFF